MKKYFRKFGIMFVMTLAIIGIGAIQNGIAANAATVGQQLTAAESGWRRYDNSDSKILYIGTWLNNNTTNKIDGVSEYNNTDWGTNTKGDTYKFKFYGSKFRIIGFMWTNRSDNIKVSIDGIDAGNFTQYTTNTIGYVQMILFERTNLSQGVHTIVVTNDSTSTNTSMDIDALDIDDTGYLVDPNTQTSTISLDKSSMDLEVDDSKQLTASTTPSGLNVTWTSSDPSIATVDENGNVTGIKEGQVTITATTEDGLTATCIVNVVPKDSDPTDPTGDANLYIELVDGQIKQYTVSSDEINKFTEWYENRDNDHSLPATYKFTKGSYTDYVVQNQIDWFEVR